MKLKCVKHGWRVLAVAREGHKLRTVYSDGGL